MNKLLATTMRRLHAEGWRFDPTADLDDLINLHRLAEAAVGADSRDPRYIAALNPVLSFAGQRFQRVSIGASVFAEECLDRWYGDSPRTLNLAWCWLLAHGRDPEAVWQHQSAGRDAFDATLRAWMRTLSVSEDELLVAVGEWADRGRRDRQAVDDGETEAPRDLSASVEELAAEYGEPDLSVWLWQRSESEVSLLWDRMQERKAAEKGMTHAAGSDRFHAAMSAYRKAELDFVTTITRRDAGSNQGPQAGGPRSDVRPEPPREAQPTHGAAQGQQGSATT